MSSKKIKTKVKKSKSAEVDDEKIINTFIEYEIYKNLQIYCEKYIGHDIQGNILDKGIFIRNLHFDNNIKLETKKGDVNWSIYIIVADTKLLANILVKDLNSMIIVYPTDSKKNIHRVIDKHKRTDVLAYSYDVFKIVLPDIPSAPKYKILSEEEAQIVCKHFKKNKHEFNKLLVTDHMAIWHGIKYGNLVEVKTVSEITSARIDYRFCL